MAQLALSGGPGEPVPVAPHWLEGEERRLLTSTELAVRDYLVEHAGQPVTQLSNAVWRGTAVEPEVVRNEVFHIRRVLEDGVTRVRRTLS